jgi:hypothetical protein
LNPGTIELTICIGDECQEATLPFSFELPGGSWRLKIKDVVRTEGDTPSEEVLSGRCILRLDGAEGSDLLKYDLAGVFDTVAQSSSATCTPRNSFTEGSIITLEDLFVAAGNVFSGQISGRAFGQQILTEVSGDGVPMMAQFGAVGGVSLQMMSFPIEP